jgi:hypothetical protein
MQDDAVVAGGYLTRALKWSPNFFQKFAKHSNQWRRENSKMNWALIGTIGAVCAVFDILKFLLVDWEYFSALQARLRALEADVASLERRSP